MAALFSVKIPDYLSTCTGTDLPDAKTLVLNDINGNEWISVCYWADLEIDFSGDEMELLITIPKHSNTTQKGKSLSQ